MTDNSNAALCLFYFSLKLQSPAIKAWQIIILIIDFCTSFKGSLIFESAPLIITSPFDKTVLHLYTYYRYVQPIFNILNHS